MNDEQLSALVDDELPGEATRQAVTELLAAPQARATWGRYHLMGDALRAAAEQSAADTQIRPPTDNVLPFAKPERSPVSRTGLGLAAAAALAAVALIISKPAPENGGASNEIAVTSLEQQRVVVDEGMVTEDSRPSFGATNVSQVDMVKDDEAQKRLNTYLINFNEQRARQRTPGVHPYVRIVGYDTP